MIEFKRFQSKSQVDLWVLKLPSDLKLLDLTKLNPAEILGKKDLDRYHRFKVLTKKNEILISRLFVKWILSKYLHNNLIDIHIEPDTFGKPFIYTGDQILPLYFNLTHTDGLLSCVFSLAQMVGVDVECINHPFSVDEEFLFLPEEIAWCNCDIKGKEKRRYALWTLKEAYLKADGRGLYIPLHSFGFSIADRGYINQSKINIHFQESFQIQDKEHWHFKIFSPTSKHILSVAVQMEEKPYFSLKTYYFNDLDIFSSLSQCK